MILAYVKNAIAEDRSKVKAPLRMRVVARPGESGRGLQGEGTRPPSTLVYVAPEAGVSAERHILNTSDQCGFGMVASGIDLQPFSKRVNLSDKGALSIQSVQKAWHPARLNQWDHPL